MDKIKVIYNWIGPRFPIWNTEVPNILSLASSAEGAHTSSEFYYTDITWRRFFANDKKTYQMFPVAAIEDHESTPYIIPYTLSWRVSFQHYFMGKTGLIEFSHTPNHIIEQVRDSNGYILIDHSDEAFMKHGDIHSLHNYFGTIHKLPLYKIIYLTGTINASTIYKEYCEVYNIPNIRENRLSIMTYPSAAYIFDHDLHEHPNEPAYETDYVPDKLFLSWNRRLRNHRVELVTHLEKNDLVDRCYISFDKNHIEATHVDYLSQAQILLEKFPNEITLEHINRFNKRLPLVLDGETDIRQMCEDVGCKTRQYYQNSLISIITETNYFEDEATLTEKSFKPIKEKHPFIIVGVPGVLQGMRELGFKTFNEFWDESYDEKTCARVRMESISQLTYDISQWSNQDILDFRKKVKPILEHNYNMLKNGSRQGLLDKIRDLIRKNIR